MVLLYTAMIWGSSLFFTILECIFGDITTQCSTIQHNAISYLLCILIFNQPKGHIKEKHNTNIKMQVRVCFQCLWDTLQWRVTNKCSWMNWKAEIRKVQFQVVGEACKSIPWPTP